MHALMRKLLVVGGLGAAATLTAQALIRRQRWFAYHGRHVLITGGSRGLGLVLARAVSAAGARVTICARTEADVRAAEDELRSSGAEVLGLVCDVRDQQQVEATVEQARARFGDVEVLFNVAGIITVGPLDAMTREDFQQCLDTHLWGPLHTTWAVLPAMRRRGWGRIVNVASLGGKRAVPHLLPYCVSKFALVGLSNGLRAELAKDGIWVTTACPSLMRTGSPRNAIFKGQHRLEYAWFSVGDSLPLAAMPAEAAAEQILKACQNGDGEVVIAYPMNLGVLFQTMLPQLTQELLVLADRILPAMGGIGRQAARGYDSTSIWSPSWLTTLTDQAAERNNEMRQHPLSS